VSSEANSSLKKTPLVDEHVKAGAKLIDFGGWLMPVQYSGIMDEHHTVRNALGVFDISHMGEFIVSGPAARAWLNELLTNNVDRLAIGQCQYTLMLNEHGGVIDDLIVYHYEEDGEGENGGEGVYLLVVNASKIEEDFAWLQGHLREGVSFENRCDTYAGLAVQGPRAVDFFAKFSGGNTLPERNGIKTVAVGGVTLLVARTGYTGEDGFELFLPAECAAKTWSAILEAGAEFGIKPCGLGARDTLRLEMCYPLNGSDLSPERSPLEAGLGFFVDLEKPSFIGRDTLLRQKAEGVPSRLVPLRMLDKSPPPRAHYPVLKNGEVVGELSSGSLSPSLGAGIGMAYLPAGIARANEAIEIDIRGRRFAAVVEKKPLYRKS